MKNPLEMFFGLGDKVTGGDPYRKASFDYYLMWVIFLSFGMIGVSNFNSFYQTRVYSYLGWGLVMLAICWFQYSSLKMSYEARKIMKSMKTPVKEMNEIEDVNKMLEKTQ